MGTQHRAEVFVDRALDPREVGGTPRLGDERATLVEFLRCQRLTLQVKCNGLGEEQMAQRSIEPSTMSLLGLVRHMAVADHAVVSEAWAAWREEIAFADRFIAEHDLDFVGADGAGKPLSLRELLVHVIEEYARHNGPADLLRERIDGRVGDERHRRCHAQASVINRGRCGLR